MFSSRASRLRAACAALCCLAPGIAAQESAPPLAPEPGSYHAALVTYGPGDIYWQRFGHNAIWLREPARGLDHAFNFGFFDFEQENFITRFVQGRMLYFAAMLPIERELEYYRSEGRSIRVQELALDPGQYQRLREHLLEHVEPENRDYLYDYYLDNCSTRLRDALDLALGGALAAQFRPQTADQTFRDHTRRSTVDDYWYSLGLELALGMPVDRTIDRWEEMFLPALLARNLEEVSLPGGSGALPLIRSDRLLWEGAAPPPPRPPETWPRYLALSLAVLALVWALGRGLGPRPAEAALLAWLLTAGSVGLFLVAVWAWTDHQAGYPNLNLLLFHPLLLLGLLPALRRPVAGLIMLGALGAVMLLGLPSLQYTRDVTALALPLSLAAAWRLWRAPPLRGRIRDWRAGRADPAS